MAQEFFVDHASQSIGVRVLAPLAFPVEGERKRLPRIVKDIPALSQGVLRDLLSSARGLVEPAQALEFHDLLPPAAD